jgi:hypothetical protein
LADGFSNTDDAMAAIAAGEVSDVNIVGRCYLPGKRFH